MNLYSVLSIVLTFGGILDGIVGKFFTFVKKLATGSIDFITGLIEDGIQFTIDIFTWVPTPTRSDVLSEPTDPIWSEIFKIYETFTDISAVLLILGFTVVLIANGIGLVPTPQRNKIAGRAVVASFFLFIPTVMAELLIIPLYVTSGIVDFFVDVGPAADAFAVAMTVSLGGAATGPQSALVIGGIWILILLFFLILVAFGVFRAIGLIAVIALFPFFLTLWAIGIGPLRQIGNLGRKGMSWYIPLAIFPIPCALMFGLGTEFISGPIFAFSDGSGGGEFWDKGASLLLGLGFLTLGPIIGLQMTKIGKAASSAVATVAVGAAAGAVVGPGAAAAAVSQKARSYQLAKSVAGDGGGQGQGQAPSAPEGGQAVSEAAQGSDPAEEAGDPDSILTTAKDGRIGEASKRAVGTALHGGPDSVTDSVRDRVTRDSAESPVSDSDYERQFDSDPVTTDPGVSQENLTFVPGNIQNSRGDEMYETKVDTGLGMLDTAGKEPDLMSSGDHASVELPVTQIGRDDSALPDRGEPSDSELDYSYENIHEYDRGRDSDVPQNLNSRQQEDMFDNPEIDEVLSTQVTAEESINEFDHAQNTFDGTGFESSEVVESTDQAGGSVSEARQVTETGQENTTASATVPTIGDGNEQNEIFGGGFNPTPISELDETPTPNMSGSDDASESSNTTTSTDDDGLPDDTGLSSIDMDDISIDEPESESDKDDSVN